MCSLTYKRTFSRCYVATLYHSNYSLRTIFRIPIRYRKPEHCVKTNQNRKGFPQSSDITQLNHHPSLSFKTIKTKIMIAINYRLELIDRFNQSSYRSMDVSLIVKIYQYANIDLFYRSVLLRNPFVMLCFSREREVKRI